MCRMSRNLGVSTFWNTLGLSRPVTELFYLHNKHKILPHIQNMLLIHYADHPFTLITLCYHQIRKKSINEPILTNVNHC
jgi:aromatic ring-cleaving dioxygenase